MTALLVFFGYTRSRAYFGYFGIDQGVLNYSLQDHVLRSADSTFGAAVRALAVILVLVAIDRLLARWTRPGSNPRSQQLLGRPKVGRIVRVGLVAVGLLLITLCLLSSVGVPVATVRVSEQATAVGLALGAIIVLRIGPYLELTAGEHKPLVEASGTVEVGQTSGTGGSTRLAFGKTGRSLAVVVLLLALFWACTLYASGAGEEVARQVDDEPAHLPLVTVFSDEYLDLPGELVDMSEIRSPAGESSYRYTGLRLLTHSNDRWFLLTGRYAQGYRSSAVILRDSDAVRVEVARQRDIGR